MTITVGKPLSYEEIFEKKAKYRVGKYGVEDRTALLQMNQPMTFARECRNCGAPNQTIDYPCRYCGENVQP